MSLECYGLRSLKMSISGHDCIRIFVTLIFKSFDKILYKRKSCIAFFAKIEPDIKSNLVVAASARVKAFTRGTYALCKSLLNKSVEARNSFTR